MTIINESGLVDGEDKQTRRFDGSGQTLGMTVITVPPSLIPSPLSGRDWREVQQKRKIALDSLYRLVLSWVKRYGLTELVK